VKFDPRQHQRRSMRLKDYDYAQPGAYFMTLCTWQREALFGEVAGGKMRLNPLGRIVQAEWERLASQFLNITLEAFVVMPNHVHGIIVIHDRATRRAGIEVLFGNQRGAPQIGVGATHRMQDVNLSGKQPAPIETGDGHGGSPETIGNRDGATRRMRNDAEDGNHNMRLGFGIDPYGSPVQGAGGAGDGATENDGGVGATHNVQIVIPSGNEPAPNENVAGHGGSPGQEMAESSERENRATRRYQMDVSMDERYGQTESGGWVDGSPLRNDDVDRDNDDGLPNRMNEELLDNREMGMKYTTTDSLERENRATRRSQMDVSTDNGYGATESDGWVDGSPLQNDGVDRVPKRPATGSLGTMIGQFKSRVTKRIWAIPEFDHTPIWQRNYYEHIIRNEADWRRTCKYIRENPLRWEEDQLHPDAPPNPFNQDKEHG
jgi:REP element-mobilizing transposase RayT